MKKIAFLSGTRADWGKIKSLLQEVKDNKKFKYQIFVCGMHLLEQYGKTFIEIFKDGFDEVFLAKPHKHHQQMDLALADTIKQFSSFIKSYQPDLIVVHGDRLEALAGTIVGAFNNILVAHIEGGEVSGTIDESIRHSISKLSHVHFVANEEAQKRLLQLGEENIHIIGSPDIDIMLSANLPTFKQVQEHYFQIQKFNGDYGIFIYHPVTTELEKLPKHIKITINALKKSKQNFVVIYPNNDLGSKIIIKELEKLKECENFAIFSSIKFEAFLTLLKNAKLMIGNSSAGVREAPFYAIPTINLGSRQEGRYKNIANIISIPENEKLILEAIQKANALKIEKNNEFGEGESAKKFIEILQSPSFWEIKLQKKFMDL